MEIEIFGKSIKGRRDTNQDKIFYEERNNAFIMAVADGVGGNYGGETASKIAICQCKKAFYEFVKNPDEYNMKRTLQVISDNARRQISEAVAAKPILKNMGTTLTLVLGMKNYYVIGNIGDSRTYLNSDGWFQQLTNDHSYLNEYAEKFPEQEIDPVMKEQLKHIITRSITTHENRMDIFPSDAPFFQLRDGDRLLLCSDGLLPDKLTDNGEDLQTIIDNNKSAESAVKKLVEFAYEEGSRDNISVIIGSFYKN